MAEAVLFCFITVVKRLFTGLVKNDKYYKFVGIVCYIATTYIV